MHWIILIILLEKHFDNMSEPIFADGFILKAPHDKAPDYIKGSISVKVDEAIAFLEMHKDAKGWVNLDLKVAKNDKWYIQKNEWKPEKKAETSPSELPDYTEEVKPEDIPF